jgi:hypothetical protein
MGSSTDQQRACLNGGLIPVVDTAAPLVRSGSVLDSVRATYTRMRIA